MSESDRKLGELYREAHSADEPPPFARSWRAAVARSGPSAEGRGEKEILLFTPTARGGSGRWRVRRWVWAPAALLLAVVSVAGALRIRSAQRQRDLAQEVSLWAARDPLGFLLETPGNELLQTVPTFDSKGEWR